MTPYTDLLARLEAATEGSRELDLEICKAIGIAPADAVWDRREIERNLKDAKQHGLMQLPESYLGHKQWITPSFRDAQRKYDEEISAFIATRTYTAEDAQRWYNEHPHPIDSVDWKNAPATGFVPHYTTSPDAALTLVPEGWDWSLHSGAVALVCENWDNDYAQVFRSKIVVPRVRHQRFETQHNIEKTPALALCIAALRARQSLGEQK